MSSSKVSNLSLKLKNKSILNCFGIQPVFVENNTIPQSFLASIYRAGTSVYKTGKMHQFNSYRIGKENDVILKNAFHISRAD